MLARLDFLENFQMCDPGHEQHIPEGQRPNEGEGQPDWRFTAIVMFGEMVGPKLIAELSDETLAELLTVGLGKAFHRHALSILSELEASGIAGVATPILELRSRRSAATREKCGSLLNEIAARKGAQSTGCTQEGA
jgi:hypothetical protein